MARMVYGLSFVLHLHSPQITLLYAGSISRAPFSLTTFAVTSKLFQVLSEVKSLSLREFSTISSGMNFLILFSRSTNYTDTLCTLPAESGGFDFFPEQRRQFISYGTVTNSAAAARTLLLSYFSWIFSA
jgi:hypothetical protein